MGLLDRLLGKRLTPATSNVFSFLLGNSAPDMKVSDYLAAYSGWVYACVNAIAEEVGSMELTLQKRGRDGWTDVDDHLALGPLQAVNPFMSSSELLLATQAFLELSGDAFWWMPQGTIVKKPLEIWLLDPARTHVVRHPTRFIGGYVYKNEKGEDIPLAPDEVLHFKRFNPRNRYRGLGTVQAAALSIDIDTYAAKWNRNFFFNSAMPSAVLEAEGTLTQQQYDRIKTNWHDRYGGVDNAHKLAITEGGLKYKPISLSQRDMDFLETRRYSRDEIMGIFRVPKSVLGITEDVNRANAEATDYVFSKRVIKPRMGFLADRLTEFYLPLFGLDARLWRFSFTDPVPQNTELDLRRRDTGLRNGSMTINEAREEEGRDPVEGGDTILIPAGMQTLEQTITPPAPVEVEEEPEDETPPAKAVNKSAGDDPTAHRVRFITTQIRKRRKDYEAIFRQMQERLQDRLAPKKGRRPKALKEFEETQRTNELVRFLFADWDDWIGVLLEPTRDTLEASLTEAGKQAIASLDLTIDFDLLNPNVLDWLNTNALRHARSVSDTVREEITLRIMQGVEQGQGAEEIATSIGAFFDGQSQWRALRIARSETISGYAEGTLAGYRQSGIVRTKRWLTAGDSRVDPECLLNEEQGAIPLESPFASGHRAPVTHPNCRCVLTTGE